jgi:hypothetical protein
MTDRHWDGIAACCRPENKVALGFVEIRTHRQHHRNGDPTKRGRKSRGREKATYRG